MYKVLWIDDKYKELVQFAIEASNEGLILEGYQSFEEGFEALEKNLEGYDVILLDGLFFEKKGQEAGTEDEIGIGMAISRINELKSKKVFPWFVLSGQDRFTKDENTLLKANKVKCFDKTSHSDVVQLFEEMRTAASQQADTQLKHKYADLVEVCSDKFLGSGQFIRLFTLIKHMENVEELFNTEDMLTPIRKIMERMFSRMADQGIIPKAIISNRGWIKGSSLFLSNKHLDYEHISEIAPPLVSENIYRLLNIIQDGSHGEGDLKFKVDEYLKTAQSDYLYRSSVYLLFDILLWFKNFMESNSDVEENKGRWKSKIDDSDWLFGIIIQINENGSGVFREHNEVKTISIPPFMVKNNQLEEGDEIKIITEPRRDGIKPYIKAISKEV